MMTHPHEIFQRSQVNYEKWKYKSNPKFPTPEKVRDEIVQMLKGMFCASICPAISVELAKHGYSQVRMENIGCPRKKSPLL